MFLLRLLILAVIGYQNVLASKKLMCSFENSICLTEGAQNAFKEFTSGTIKGITIDPIHADFVAADLPTIKYTLHNVTFSGMNSCSTELLQMNVKQSTYKHHFACRHLTLNGLYEAKGQIGPQELDGHGHFKVELYDYVFLFNGEMGMYFDEEEKLHVQILDTRLDIDARGKVVYDIENLYNGDEERSAAVLKFMNVNWKFADKTLRQPTMEKLMSYVTEKCNIYLNKFPVEHIFPNND